MLWLSATVYLAGLAAFGVWNRDKLLFALLWPLAAPARVLVFTTMLVMVGFDSMS